MGSRREIERKFLIAGDVPLKLGDQPSGPSRTRVEEEIEVDQRCFESLRPLTEGRRIKKRRFSIPADGRDDRSIELDVYCGDLSGLVPAEVEFRSEREADEFNRRHGWART